MFKYESAICHEFFHGSISVLETRSVCVDVRGLDKDGTIIDIREKITAAWGGLCKSVHNRRKIERRENGGKGGALTDPDVSRKRRR